MEKKVFVVEDDEGILDAITIILEDEGFEVKPVINAQEVFTQLSGYNPDLILLDVLMSGVDGRDVCCKLKESEETKHIPIVMVSAHPSAKESIKKCGADDFLAKPFEAEDLIQIVKKYTAS